ncbi:MAG: conjugal transfer protein TrbI [Nitrospira sp.]|nr:conjugal transfer protein TrbI [Nitrospira sp.]MDR4478119.1 conjugal transfer protein TrbI [Nitrospira sp.]
MSHSANPQMSPERSPGSISPGAGVRRANKIPLYLVIGLIAVVAFVVAMVANDRAQKQEQMLKSTTGPHQQGKGGGTLALADRIAGSHLGGVIPPAPPKPLIRNERTQPETALVGAGGLDAEGQVKADILIARPDDLDAPPMPNRAGGLQLVTGKPLSRTASSEERDALRLAKIQQLQDALKAPSTVTFSLVRSEKPAPTITSQLEHTSTSDPRNRLAEVKQQVANAARSDDPTKAYQAQLTQLRQSGMLGPFDGGSESSPTARLSAPSGTTSSANPAGGDRWKHDGAQLPPRAEFVIQAGDVLPALMLSEIDSALPGQIVAQVSQHVYDTPTKTQLLIPQGTKLIGTYSSEVGYGQKALLVAWQRLGYPDGKTLDIGSMPGATGAGASGLTDLVNNHYMRLFGSALLMSAVTAGVTFSQQQAQGAGIPGQVGIPQYNAGTAMSQALGQQLGQVTAQLIAKNLSIAPELTIRPGYRFNVVVVKDLVLPKPYQEFDYAGKETP